jgi:ABC-2 type transport system permease protein
MRTIISIIKKEFTQVFRNKTMLPIIFVIPLVQLLVLVYATSLDMKSINLLVVDKDLTPLSKELESKFTASPFFIVGNSISVSEAEKEILNNNADVIIVIPQGFEKNITNENSSELQFLFNAINGTKASIANGYSQRIVYDFNQNIILNSGNLFPETAEFQKINIENSFWYNPRLDYKIYMSSGILVILVTIISLILSGMNLVREKESGTIEQINVTPIKKYQFIIGKLIPFLIIALFELAFGLTIAKILFKLPFEGSLLLLFGSAIIYLITMLSIGLLMSVFSETQQQLMFIAYFFVMVFILMSGIFTPAETMPQWAQKLNYINPISYFMKIVRMILLKGSGLKDIINELLALVIYGSLTLTFAVVKYRKRA